MSVLLSAAVLAVAQDAARSLAQDLYRTQMAAAESAVRLGELGAARGWLDEVEPSARGFEWKVLDATLDESLSSFALAGEHAYALDVSPDDRQLVCGLADGQIELRDAASGALIALLGKHEQSLSFARFSGDGARVVTSSFDRTAKVWDVAGRSLVASFDQHGFPVGGAAFSPDGKLVASCSYARPPGTVVGTVHVWDASNGSLERTLEGGRKPLVGIEFSPDGKKLAAGSWDFCVFVWDLESGAGPVELAVPDEGIYNAVDGCAWSPDGKLVAAAAKDKTARVWDVANGELVATLRGHTDYVARVAFSPDGAALATGSADATVKLWNTSDWSLRSTLRGHGKAIADLCFASDGQRLFTSSEDKSVRTWDASTTWNGGVKLATTGAAYVARFSPDDRRLAVCGFDGRIQLWSTATWDELASWQAHPDGKSCHALAWTGDGRFLVSGSWEPFVRVWDSLTLDEVATFEQAEGTYYLDVSRDGRWTAACNGKRVTVWNLGARSKALDFTGHTSTTMGVSFSPDSKLCVSTGRDGKAIVWEAASGATRFEIAGADPDVTEALFTPDGAALVVAARNGVVRMHSASDGALVRELARNEHGVDHIDISPDGARVAFAAEVVGLVDLAHGRIVGRLRPHAEHPYNVDFDSTGERLASCSTDKTVAISDVRPLRERLAQREAGALLRAVVEGELGARLAADEPLQGIADSVWNNRALFKDARAAWIEAITRRAARGR